MTQSGRKVRISFKSDILGNDIFWEGFPYCEADTIKNIPAKQIAKATAHDGKSRQCGMWFSEVIESA